MKVATILDRIWNEKLAPLPLPTEKKEEFKQQRKFDRSTTLYFTDTGYSGFEEDFNSFHVLSFQPGQKEVHFRQKIVTLFRLVIVKNVYPHLSFKNAKSDDHALKSNLYLLLDFFNKTKSARWPITIFFSVSSWVKSKKNVEFQSNFFLTYWNPIRFRLTWIVTKFLSFSLPLKVFNLSLPLKIIC